MTVYLLCNPAFIKDFLIIDKNVDDSIIRTAIMDAQEIDVHQLLGSELLSEIKQQASTNTLTPDNQLLLDEYIRPCIARFALVYLVLLLNNRFTARGVVSKESDSSSIVSGNDYDNIRDELRNYAEFYAQRMLKFIIANISKYSKYYSVSDVSKMKSKLNSYTINWNLSGVQRDDLNNSRLCM